MSLEKEVIFMMDSILISLKKFLGIDASYTIFDPDIMIHANTAFAILNQLGVGPEEGFMIESEDETWDSYISDYNFMMVKTFIYLKVKLLFDPPSNASLYESMNRQLDELTWRLELESNIHTDK
jgi:hypothetical protein